jgi:hypothetical protein
MTCATLSSTPFAPATGVPTVSPRGLTCCGARLNAFARLALYLAESFSTLVVFLVLADLEECCANICDGTESKKRRLKQRARIWPLRERKAYSEAYLEVVVIDESFVLLFMKGSLPKTCDSYDRHYRQPYRQTNIGCVLAEQECAEDVICEISQGKQNCVIVPVY